MPRMHELDKHLTQGEQLQGRVLSHLLLSAQDTEYGREQRLKARRHYKQPKAGKLQSLILFTNIGQ